MDWTKFEKTITVEYPQCDLNNRMHLFAILQQGQQISMEHCDHLPGMGKQELEPKHLAFLLAKLHLEITKLPLAGQSITMRTEPFQPVLAQFPRFTTFFDEHGEQLMRLDARWILVDTTTLRILRRPGKELPMEFPSGDPLPDFPSCRVQEMEAVEDVPVRYSLLDSNHHVNNAMYAQFVSNCVEDRILAGQEITSFAIVYHNQAQYGQTITLLRKDEGANSFVKGMLGGTICFESSVGFRE